jgi:hypothetical protein
MFKTLNLLMLLSTDNLECQSVEFILEKNEPKLNKKGVDYILFKIDTNNDKQANSIKTIIGRQSDLPLELPFLIDFNKGMYIRTRESIIEHLKSNYFE